MSFVRRAAVWVVASATLAAATWVYTYQVPVIVRFIDATGTPFHPAESSTEQPWWGVPATVLVVLLGAVAIIWLAPATRGVLRRFAAQFGVATPRQPVEPSRARKFGARTH